MGDKLINASTWGGAMLAGVGATIITAQKGA